MKKSIILAVVLLVAGLAVVHAQEIVADEAPVIAVFPQYGMGQMFNVTPMAYPSGIGGKLGIGILNIFFGLGSYIAGDWPSGLLITAFQGGGIAATALGIWWMSSIDIWTGIASLGILPLLALGTTIGGGIVYISGIITGLITPFSGAGKSRKSGKSGNSNNPPQFIEPSNWTFGFLPTQDGSFAGVLAFTAHFR